MIDLQNSSRRRQESDYEWHLENPSARKGAKPERDASRYLDTPPPGATPPRTEDEDEDAAAEDGGDEDTTADDNRTDSQIDFARDLLGPGQVDEARKTWSASSKAFFDKRARRGGQEGRRGAGETGRRLVGGRRPRPTPGQLQVNLAPVGGDGKVAAGNAIKVRGTVKNKGSATVSARAPCSRATTCSSTRARWCSASSPRPGKTRAGGAGQGRQGRLTRTDVIHADVMEEQGPVKAQAEPVMLKRRRHAAAAVRLHLPDHRRRRSGQRTTATAWCSAARACVCT